MQFSFTSLFFYCVTLLVAAMVFSPVLMANMAAKKPTPGDHCENHGEIFPGHNCAVYYLCDTDRVWVTRMCVYPDLFSTSTHMCESFNNVDCDGREVSLSPCGYSHRCHNNDTGTCICHAHVGHMDVDWGYCWGRGDGVYLYQQRPWSPSYIQCWHNRTVPRTCEGNDRVFDYIEKTCSSVDVVIEKYFGSTDVPDALLQLLTTSTSSTATTATTATTASQQPPHGACTTSESPAPGFNCAVFYNCISSIWQRQTCAYPDLFSMESLRCENFNVVDCGGRATSTSPCDYMDDCSTNQTGTCLCPHHLMYHDVDWGFCQDKTNGNYVYHERPWSPFYITCDRHRTLPTRCMQSGTVIFDHNKHACSLVYEVIAKYFVHKSVSTIPDYIRQFFSTSPAPGSEVTSQVKAPTVHTHTTLGGMATAAQGSEHVKPSMSIPDTGQGGVPTASMGKEQSGLPTSQETGQTRMPTINPQTGQSGMPTQSPQAGQSGIPMSSPGTGKSRMPTANPQTGASRIPTPYSQTGRSRMPTSSPQIGRIPTSPERSEVPATTTQTGQSGMPTANPQTGGSGMPTSSPQTGHSRVNTTSPQTGHSGVNTTSPQTGHSGVNTTSPQTGHSGIPTSSPQTGHSGVNTTSPQTGHSGVNTTSPQTGHSGIPTSSPQTGHSGVNTTSPQTGHSGMPTTNPQTEQSGVNTTSSQTTQSGIPASSTQTERSEVPTTSPQKGHSGVNTTSPQTGHSGIPTSSPQTEQSGVNTTSPQTGQSGMPTANPQTGGSGMPTSSPQTGHSRMPITSPQTGNGEISTSPQTGQSGIPTSSPQTEQSGVNTTSSQTTQRGIPTSSPQTEQSGVNTTSSQTGQSGIPTSSPQTGQTGIPTSSPQTEQSGVNTTSSQTTQRGIPTSSPQTEQSGVSTTSSQTTQRGIPTSSPQTEQSGVNTTSSQTGQSGIPTSSPQTGHSGVNTSPRTDRNEMPTVSPQSQGTVQSQIPTSLGTRKIGTSRREIGLPTTVSGLVPSIFHTASLGTGQNGLPTADLETLQSLMPTGSSGIGTSIMPTRLGTQAIGHATSHRRQQMPDLGTSVHETSGDARQITSLFAPQTVNQTLFSTAMPVEQVSSTSNQYTNHGGLSATSTNLHGHSYTSASSVRNKNHDAKMSNLEIDQTKSEQSIPTKDVRWQPHFGIMISSDVGYEMFLTEKATKIVTSQIISRGTDILYTRQSDKLTIAETLSSSLGDIVKYLSEYETIQLPDRSRESVTVSAIKLAEAHLCLSSISTGTRSVPISSKLPEQRSVFTQSSLGGGPYLGTSLKTLELKEMSVKNSQPNKILQTTVQSAYTRTNEPFLATHMPPSMTTVLELDSLKTPPLPTSGMFIEDSQHVVVGSASPPTQAVTDVDVTRGMDEVVRSIKQPAVTIISTAESSLPSPAMTSLDIQPSHTTQNAPSSWNGLALTSLTYASTTHFTDSKAPTAISVEIVPLVPSYSVTVHSETVLSSVPIQSENVLGGFPVQSETVLSSVPEQLETVSSSVPVYSETVSSSVPVYSETVSSSVLVYSETVSSSVPVHSETVSSNVLVYSETVSSSVSVNSETVSSSVPVYSETMLSSVPVHSETVSSSVPVNSETVSSSVPVYSEAMSSSVPVHSETVSSSVPVHSETVSSSVPVNSETVSSSVSVNSETVSSSVPVYSETMSSSVPVHSETVSSSVPVNSETVSSSVPVYSEAMSSSVPVHSETVSSSVPVHSETVSSSVPVNSETVSSSVPVYSETVSSSVPVNSSTNPHDNGGNTRPISNNSTGGNDDAVTIGLGVAGACTLLLIVLVVITVKIRGGRGSGQSLTAAESVESSVKPSWQGKEIDLLY